MNAENECLSLESRQERADRLYKQLLAMPDAFDRDTGRLNAKNQQAVILYELVVNAYTIANDTIWSLIDERTENPYGSDTANS